MVLVVSCVGWFLTFVLFVVGICDLVQDLHTIVKFL